MSLKTTRMRKIVAQTAVAATATAISTTMGLLTAPAPAHAACELWDWKPTAFAIEQDNGVLVELYSKTHGAQYIVPHKTDWTHGTYYGTINGRSINFTANWNQGPGAGLSNTYTGQIDDNGVASGTTTNSQGVTNSWHSTDKLVCAPTGTAVGVPPEQAPQKPPPEAAPVTYAITLTFSPPGFGNITATIANSSDLTAKCTYDATGLTKTHRDFTVNPHGSTDLTFTGFNTGTSYHVVVACKDASGKQTQEIGRAEQDVTF